MIRQPTKDYPFQKEFEAAQWDPFLILHSSGSTDPPKPVVMNHGSLAVSDNDRNLWQVPGRRNQNTALWNFKDGGGYFSALPPFNTVKQVLSEAEISDTDDLYMLGLDSLKTTELVLILKVGLLKLHKEMDLSWLSSHTIYRNPKAVKLAVAIYLTLNPGFNNMAALNGVASPRLDDMAAMIEKYTLALPKRMTEKKAMKKSENLTVVVTDTTGSLRTYLLDQLLSSTLISKVYAMNRSVDANTSHKVNFAT